MQSTGFLLLYEMGDLTSLNNWPEWIKNILRKDSAFLRFEQFLALLPLSDVLRLKATLNEDGMATFTTHFLHAAAQCGGLSPRFPDGHIALYLVLKSMFPQCVLHRYTLRLDNASTTDTSYGFALECNGVVWCLANVVGWSEIEKHEREHAKRVFEEWAGGPAVSVIFLHDVFDAHSLPQSPYVIQKIQLLQTFFTAHHEENAM